ncbi:MAG: hypothetical protein HZR80_16630 [Candidatus Heimdallarchaeota archaeon]
MLKSGNLSKEQELRIIVYQSEILNYTAKFHESLKLTSKVLKESASLDNLFLVLDTYWQQIISFTYTAQYKECMAAIEKGLGMIEAAKEVDLKEISKRKSYFLINKGIMVNELGDIASAIELFKAGYESAEKSENKDYITLAKGWYSYMLSQTDQKALADKLADETLKIVDLSEKKTFQVFVYFPAASAKMTLGNYNIAKDYFCKAIELCKETGTRILLRVFYLHLGIIHNRSFNLDEALKYYVLALDETEESRYLYYTNICEIYLLKNEIKKAQEYYIMALEESKSMGEQRVRPGIIYSLIFTSILLNNIPQTEEYLKELEKLSKETGLEAVTRKYQFAKVLLLKESTRIQDWLNAVEILEKLLKDETLPIDSQIDALYHLVEIRLKELQLTADQEVLTEVKKQIEKIQSFAEERKQFNLIINIYRLKSQLALVELDAEKAVELLITAKTLAEDKKLDLIAHNIKEEQAKLAEQQNMCNRLREQKAPMVETLKQVNLGTSAKQIANETIMEVRDDDIGKVVEYRKLFALKI